MEKKVTINERAATWLQLHNELQDLRRRIEKAAQAEQPIDHPEEDEWFWYRLRLVPIESKLLQQATKAVADTLASIEDIR